jgi:hypothetical protein
MKRGVLDTVGNLLFDYMILTILFAGSVGLILPMLPLIAGFQHYVECDLHSRKLTMIFTHIKDHLGLILKWTFTILMMVSVSLVNILWLQTPFQWFDNVIKVLSYVVLWIALTCIIHSPTLMKNMNLNFKQLIRNSMMLVFGNPMHYLLSLGLVAILLYTGMQSIITFILGLPLVLYAVARLSYINFTQTKERMK